MGRCNAPAGRCATLTPVPNLDIPLLGWVVLGLSALVVGIAKTSIGGIGALAVAGFAVFLPARESTAAVLLLLLIGDVVAVAVYRRSADGTLLRRLLPAVLPGIVIGALVMKVVDDRTMTLVIAVCILAALALQVWVRRRQDGHSEQVTTAAGVAAGTGTEPGTGAKTTGEAGDPDGGGTEGGGTEGGGTYGARAGSTAGGRRAAAVGAGVAAGFTTMVANAAGPVMALYLLTTRVDKMRFVGTNAWFFLLVNLSKVPFSAGLGLFPTSTLVLTVVLAPVVLVGTVIGRRLLRVLDQRRFERYTLVASLIAGLVLLVRAAF